MPSYKDLIDAIEIYKRQYRNPKLPDYVSGPMYDFYPKEEQQSVKCDISWPGTWPNSEYPGIYAFFDNELNLLYIGKASMSRSIGDRLGSYCLYDENKECKFKDSGWSIRPRYLWTIGVPKSMAFEAPALEEYLIKTLQPPDNKSGK